MKQDQRFFELLNAAGQLPTKVNDIVASTRDRLTAVIDTLGNELGSLPRSSRDVVANARGTLDEIRRDVLELGSHNSAVGERLKDLETWGQGSAPDAPPVSQPSEPVVDQSPDAPGTGFPVMTKEQADGILKAFDQCIAAGREDWAFYYLSNQETFALQNRGWKRNDINLKINRYSGGAAPRDIANSPRPH